MPLEHIHPMIVHFPIVLLLLAAALDVLNVVRGNDLAGSRRYWRGQAGWRFTAARRRRRRRLDSAISRRASPSTMDFPTP